MNSCSSGSAVRPGAPELELRMDLIAAFLGALLFLLIIVVIQKKGDLDKGCGNLCKAKRIDFRVIDDNFLRSKAEMISSYT